MNDDQLREYFRALRKDDARHLPAFDRVVENRAPIEHPATRGRSVLRRYWQLSLVGTAAAVFLVATQHWQRGHTTDLAAIDNSPTTESWTVPSDYILGDKLTSALPETTEHLTGEIDQLLKP